MTATPHAVGARRMWIRRWLKAGKIDQTEARRLSSKLEQVHIRRTRVGRGRSVRRNGVGYHPGLTSPTVVSGSPRMVTLQYDPSLFSVEFHRRRHRT